MELRKQYPLASMGTISRLCFLISFSKLPHFCSRIVGCFLQGNQNFLRYPLRNENHFWPAGLLLKGVCLQQVIKAGVNMVKM